MKISCKLEKWLSTLRSGFLLLTLSVVQLCYGSTKAVFANFYVPNSICEGKEVVFVNTSSYGLDDTITFMWLFEGAAKSFQKNGVTTWPVQNTTRLVSVTLKAYLQNGDSSSITKSVVIHPLPSADFTAEFVGENSYQLNAAHGMDIYIWEYGVGKTSSAQNPIIPWEEFDDSCEVCLTVRNRFCWNTKCQIICPTIGVKDVSLLAKQIEIYPNPTNGVRTFIIETALLNPNIHIFDLTGKVHVVSIENINTNVFSVASDSLEDGVYFVRVVGGGYSAVKKLIVQH